MFKIEKITKIIDNLLYTGIVTIVFLVPIYFSLFYKDFSVFSLDKVVVFRIIVEILIGLQLIKILLARKIDLSNDKRVYYVLSLIFLSSFLAWFFSTDQHSSFWGSYWRQEGFFTQLHLYAFILLVLTNLNSKGKIKILAISTVCSAAIISLYAIIQWFGLDPMVWNGSNQPFQRITSTFGQPVFLANFLIMSIYLTIYLMIQSRKWFLYLCLLILSFEFAALIMTYTRGAWIGLAIGLIVLAFVVIKDNKKLSKKYSVYFSIFIAICLLFFTAYILYANNNFTYRIKSIADTKNGSAGMRVEYWKAGLDLFKNKPLLGYGLESEKNYIFRYYKPYWSLNEKILSTPDRVHNEYLDLALTGGFVRLLAYLSLLIYVSLIYFKSDRALDKKILFFGIVSYQIALMTSFSTIETSIVFWTYICILVVLCSDISTVSFKLSPFLTKAWVVLLLPLLILDAYAIIYLNINWIRADYFLREARLALVANHYDITISNYYKTFELNPYETFYKELFINDLMQISDSIKDDQTKINILGTILKSTNEDFGRSNNNLIFSLSLARYYIFCGKYLNVSYYNSAESLLKEVAAASPYFPDTYKLLSDMYYDKEDYERAIKIANDIFLIMPDISNSNSNIIHINGIKDYMSVVYENIAKSYYKLNELDEAAKYYKEILQLNPYYYNSLHNLATINEMQKKYEIAIYYYNKLFMYSGNQTYEKKIISLKTKL